MDNIQEEAPLIESVEVSKAESNPTLTSDRFLKSFPIGTNALVSIGGYIRDAEKRDLQYPYSIQTYKEMLAHPVVGAAVEVGEVFLVKSLMKAKFVPNPKSEKSKQAAAFANWNLRNLEGGGWYEAVTNFVTCFKYGFSWSEKIYGANDSQNHPEFKYKLKRFAPRSVDSVKEWWWKDPVTKHELLGLIQKKNQQSVITPSYTSPVYTSAQSHDEPKIRMEKMMFFSWNSVNGNPQGTSDLKGVYKPWKEISMIETYELMGIAKDLAGILHIEIPLDHMNKAAEDPTSDAAVALNAFKQQAASIQAGDQSFIITPSDVQGENGSGAKLYNFTLKGVDGNSKSFSTKDIIAMKEKTILNKFGAGFLTLGDNATGSYSLADTKQSLHAFFIERKLMFMADVLERQFLKQLLEINQFKLAEEDMPRFEFGELDDADVEVASKAAQRLAATGVMPLEKGILMQMWQQCGYDTTHLEDMDEEELLSKLTASTSRSGDGMKEGMNGGVGSATGSSGNNSDMNGDNTA